MSDARGLGKTATVLTFFAWLSRAGAPPKGPFLVVSAAPGLAAWQDEARKWVPDLQVARTAERKDKHLNSGPSGEVDRLGAGTHPKRIPFSESRHCLKLSMSSNILASTFVASRVLTAKTRILHIEPFSVERIASLRPKVCVICGTPAERKAQLDVFAGRASSKGVRQFVEILSIRQ